MNKVQFYDISSLVPIKASLHVKANLMHLLQNMIVTNVGIDID